MTLDPKKPQSVQFLFNKIAKNYDQMNNIISLDLQNHWRNVTNNKISLKGNEIILDLCCGTGDWTIALAKKITNGHIFGIDFSKNMLNIANKKIKKLNLENKITLIQADALQLPFSNNYFDIVTIGYGLRNLKNLDSGLKEIHRVLKSKGQFVCLESSQPTNVIVKPLWHFYMKKILPYLGKIFANSYEEYNYLQKTTHKFINYKELSNKLNNSGFQNTSYKKFLFGSTVAHFTYKA